MSKMIFVNLPVADLEASTAFYTAIGFENNYIFSDETAACMVWSETISVMLITHPRWKEFTSRPIPPAGSSEVMLAISLENRQAVDSMLEIAAKKGGMADINKTQDLGFMYNRSFTDLDGHIWEAFWMDLSSFPADSEPN